MAHYEFTGAERQIGNGPIVKQIRALVELPDPRVDLLHPQGIRTIRAGEIGGWIESATVTDESGLARPRLASHSWVADDACVYGGAWLADDARVEGTAIVSSHAALSGKSLVRDGARVSGRSRISGNAVVNESAVVFDDAVIEDNACITDSAVVCQNSRVGGSARVGGNTRIRGSAVVTASSNVFGLVTIEGDAEVAAETMICGTFAIGGHARIGSTNHLLVVHPIGPRGIFATVFYRTSSGRGEVAHRFEQPWKGSLDDFRRRVADFLARLDDSERRTLWRSQYDAFDALATLAEQSWLDSAGV